MGIKDFGSHSKNAAKLVGHSLITWEWTKRLLHWLIISAGTMSECAFLIASLWMSINSSVHPLVKLVMTDGTATHVSEVATAAYVALPEMILGLAFVVTIGHIRLWLHDKRNYSAAIWTVLYGVPTLVFLTLSLITLGCSVTSTSFTMPTPLIVIRALAGYMFAFTSLLYTQLGTPQEVDRLKKLENVISVLKQELADTIQTLTHDKDAIVSRIMTDKDAEIALLRAENTRIEAQLEAVYREKEAAIHEKTMLYTALNQTSEDALQAYGDNVIQWFNTLDKTADIDDIAAHTGINKKRLQAAIDKGDLRVRGTNKGRIWVPSLKEYLVKNAPKNTVREQETGPLLRVM